MNKQAVDEYLKRASDLAEERITDLLIHDCEFRKTVSTSLARALTDANYLRLTHSKKEDEEFVQQLTFLICQRVVHKISEHLNGILTGGEKNATGH